MSYIAEAIRTSEGLTEEQLREIGQAVEEKSYQEFIAACRAEGKSMEECAKEWKEKHPKAKGEQAAYGRPKAYTSSFINTILATLAKAGIQLTAAEKEKLRGLTGQTGEMFNLPLGEVVLEDRSTGEVRICGVYPQEPLRTGEQFQEDLDKTARLIMFGGMQHQKHKGLLDEEK